MNTEKMIKEIVKKHWPEEAPKAQDEVKLSQRIRFGVEVGMYLSSLGIRHKYGPSFMKVWSEQESR